MTCILYNVPVSLQILAPHAVIRKINQNVQKIKELIKQLKKTNPFVEGNIFKSVENVNIDTVVAYKQKGKKHHFLDMYDNEYD